MTLRDKINVQIRNASFEGDFHLLDFYDFVFKVPKDDGGLVYFDHYGFFKPIINKENECFLDVEPCERSVYK